MGTFKGTPGNDTFSGTSDNDQFNLIQGGEDTASGQGGNDTFILHGAFDAGDSIDGGAGSDTLELTGDYSAGIAFTDTTVTNVERILLGAGFSYKLTSADATVAAGQTLAIDGAHLGAGDTLNFDGSAETDGRLIMGGGAGNDTLKGGSADASFDLRAGGEDTAIGGSGSDLFLVGGALDAGDHIDGGLSFGAAHDVLRIVGDYSAGVTFGADTIQNIYTLQFGAGFDYKFTVDNNNFLSGPTALINAGGLGAANSLTFDASASDAGFHFIGGAGNDVLTGGGASLFDLSHGGNDTATGGALADHFNMGTAFNAGDAIDGGGGNDRVDIAGMGSADAIAFTATTLTNVASLVLGAGHNYDLVTNDATVAANATMLINGNTLGTGDTLIFDGSAETDGHFIIRGGAGNDVLTGGALSTTFNLTKGGSDTAHGGGGNDTFNMGGAFDATDQIDGGSGNDTLSLDGTYATPIAVSGTMAQNVENVTLAGSGYNIAWQSAIASTLTVDASTIGTGNSVIFDSTSLASGDVHLIAGAGDTVFSGGGGDDTVDLQNNTDGYDVTGGGGDDTVNFGAGFGSGMAAFDHADGNGGSNTATFDGDYSGGLTLGLQASFIFSYGLTDFQTIKLLGDHSYTVTFDDTQYGGVTLTGGAALTVDASALGAGDQAVLDFSLSSAPTVTVTGGAGADTAKFAANFVAGDAINGGAGSDTLELNGDYSAGLSFGASTLTSVETLKLDDGHSYKLTTNDANVASGATLAVDASALTGTNALTFDGSAETNGSYAVTGGAGADAIRFGNHFSVSNSINGGAGSDTLTLNNIHGVFNFTDTTMTNVETLAIASNIDVNITITTTDANVAAGATLTVDFSGVNLVDILTFDGSAEQDGHFAFSVPQDAIHAVILTGGALSDSFSLPGGDGGEENIFHGGGGDDTLNTTAVASAVHFDGGTGNDTVALTGGGTIQNTRFAFTSVENMTLDDNSWNITIGTETFAAGETLNVNATALSGSHTLTFDGSELADGGTFVFTFAGNFSASDRISGGSSSDTLALNGDYSLGVIMGATTISGIETITLADGHTYGLSTADANVAAGATLTVDASALTGSNQLFFSGSNETDGHFALIGGAGADDLEGSQQSDTFDLSRSDGAFVEGDGGNDTFTVTSRAFLLDDSIDGGAGSDTLVLNGSGFATQTTLLASGLNDIENLTLQGATNSYNIVLGNGVAGSGTFSVDASALDASHTLTFDGSGVTSNSLSIVAGAGNDTVTGGAKADTFDFTLGGTDTAHGGAGNDTFNFGATLTAADRVDGGADNDTISLNGDYSAGLTFASNSLTSIETVAVQAGHSYKFTLNESNIAFNGALTIDGSSLGAGDALTVDGSGVFDGGELALIGGAGNDVLSGTQQTDTFDLTKGGNDTVHALGGFDVITVGAAFTAADTIDGGGDGDTLEFSGDYSGGITFAATSVTNINLLKFDDGHSYKFTTNDANVANGITMTVDASALTGSNAIAFDGVAETNGAFAMTGGTGDDTFRGGAQADSFDLSKGGNDIAVGSGGNDTFNFGSTLTAADIVDGGTGNDTVELKGDYSAGFTFAAASLVNVETLQLDDGFNYKLTTIDNNVAGGATLIVDATALGSTHTLNFNGSAEHDANFLFKFGFGFTPSDILTGGLGNDTLELDGDYSHNFVFADNQLTSIETLKLDENHSYVMDLGANDVAAGHTLIVDMSGMTGGSVGFGGGDNNGNLHFIAGQNADDILGANGNDLFDMTQAPLFAVGNLSGQAGDDTFLYGANYTNPIGAIYGDGRPGLPNYGVTGNDTMEFNGNYSSLTLSSHVDSIETFRFDGNHTYNVTIGAQFATTPTNVTVDASQVSTLFTLTFSGTAYTIEVGSGGMTATPGDTTAHDDTFIVTSEAGLVNSSLDGGAGTDTLQLNGDFSTHVSLNGSVATGIEGLQLLGGANSYNLTVSDGVSSALTVDGSAAASVIFAAAIGDTTAFTITGSAGNDTLTGGNSGDFFFGGNGADTMTGRSGGDLFFYTAAAQSTGASHDTITDFDAAHDVFGFSGIVGGFDGAVTGNVSAASFNTDIGNAFNDAVVLNDHHAWEVIATGGDQSGHTYLVIDVNGDAHYTGGTDYVIDITGFTGTLSAANFT